jgi:hypothetical protein
MVMRCSSYPRLMNLAPKLSHKRGTILSPLPLVGKGQGEDQKG